MHEDVSAVASRDYGEYMAAGIRELAEEDNGGRAPPTARIRAVEGTRGQREGIYAY